MFFHDVAILNRTVESQYSFGLRLSSYDFYFHLQPVALISWGELIYCDYFRSFILTTLYILKMEKDKNIEKESKQELSEDRTGYAMERTDLARERTFSAWLRTGISAMAAGLGIARLLQSVSNEWIATTLG
jgi:hypothetical protein